MTNSNFSIRFSAYKEAHQVYNAINDIRHWWSTDFKGRSQQLNDEFEVRFGSMHYSKQKITALIPGKKIAWKVIDSYLSLLKDKNEWAGSDISFELENDGLKTRIRFTHYGLLPGIECYRDCTKGWNYYLLQSLIPYIDTGKGNPNILSGDPRLNS